jgi:hypothetical protein
MTGTDLADAVAGNDYEVYHSGHIMQDELKAWADAKLIKSRLSKIRGRVKIQGDGKVKPGDVVALGRCRSKVCRQCNGCCSAS